MANTERDIKEMKWLLRANISRLDCQHGSLVWELDRLRSQLDSLDASQPTSRDTAERSLQELEKRFDVLGNLVGREQTECAQMRQLVEATAQAVGIPSPQRAPVVEQRAPGSKSQAVCHSDLLVK
jgi:hypothetical protein